MWLEQHSEFLVECYAHRPLFALALLSLTSVPQVLDPRPEFARGALYPFELVQDL